MQCLRSISSTVRTITETRKLRVLKNKEGKLGEFTLYFDGDIQLFYEDLDEAAELKEKKERTEYEQTRIC